MMNALGVVMIASGALLLVWLYGPVQAAAVSSAPGPARTGPPGTGGLA